MAIVVPIVSNWDGKGLAKAQRKLADFSDNVRSSMGRVTNAAKLASTAVAGIGVTAGVAAFKAVTAASDIEEATSKVKVVFGDASEAVLNFSRTADRELGLSRQAVLDAAGVFGTFGKSAGLTGGDLSDFTIDFTTLAADLASFNNTTPEEAIEAIGAALRGEAEPIRKYGILLDDARLKARALELGIFSGTGTLTAQQKILAAQAEIFAQSSDAQGDFARTSDGLANRQRILRASLANTVAEIGSALLPAALAVAEFITEKILPAVEMLSEFFKLYGFSGVFNLLKLWIRRGLPDVLDGLKRFGKAIAEWAINDGLPALVDALQRWGAAFVEWIGPRIGPMIAALVDFLRKVGNWAYLVAYPWLVDKLIAWGNAFVDWIKPQISPALERLGELLVELGKWIVDVAVPELIEQAKKLGPPLWEWTKALWPEIQKGMGKLLWEVGKWVVTDGIPKLQRLGLDLGGAILKGLFVALRDINKGAAGLAAQVANALIRFINTNIIRKINSFLEFNILGVTINPPDIRDIPLIGGSSDSLGGGGSAIPKMATGGIVNSPTVAMIGEAGPEAVIPLDRLNTGGNTYVINITGALDPVSVGSQIRRLLVDTARREGRIIAI